MAKVKSKTINKANSAALSRAKHSAAQQTATKTVRTSSSRSAGSTAKPDTKHDKVLAMLRSTGGTTIAAMMKATDWQQHSVRGFLAGVVRRRLKLDLISDKTDGPRIYRIKDKQSGAGKGGATKHTA